MVPFFFSIYLFFWISIRWQLWVKQLISHGKKKKEKIKWKPSIPSSLNLLTVCSIHTSALLIPLWSSLNPWSLLLPDCCPLVYHCCLHTSQHQLLDWLCRLQGSNCVAVRPTVPQYIATPSTPLPLIIFISDSGSFLCEQGAVIIAQYRSQLTFPLIIPVIYSCPWAWTLVVKIFLPEYFITLLPSPAE